MTDDTNSVLRESEPLHAVLHRALRGQSRTQGCGPFFIVCHWETGKIQYCPMAFESVEEAMLYFAQHSLGVEPGGWVTVCFRLNSKWVQ
jgi:hypothetical protein